MPGRTALSMTEDNLVLLGEIGRAHGLKGEVRVKSFTADPTAIADYNPLTTETGQRIVLTTSRRAPGGAPDLLVVRIEGVSTREAAEALNRARLYAPRDRLSPTEDEDEFFLADLIGLSAIDPTGAPIGTVVAVPNYGGGDLVEIAPSSGGPSLLLPFTKNFVPSVDLAAKRLVVDYAESDADNEIPSKPHTQNRHNSGSDSE